jgi:carbamoyltransferase
MYILGLNAYHGDAAAAIIRDGHLIAAVEEERFNRQKHCAGFPTEAIRYCLDAARIRIEDVEHIGISRDPAAHLHKKILFAATRMAKNLAGVAGAQAVGERSGPGLLRSIGDRMANAARVRDLGEELARELGVSRVIYRA